MDVEVASQPRKLGPDDLKACLRLDRRALKGLWTTQQWEQELSDKARLVLGLEDRGGLLLGVASAWLVMDELQIMAVAVDPSHQRCGIGARMLNALLDCAGQLSAAMATLEVASGNAAARRLYARCGFVITGRRRAYYRNGEDALLLQRPIVSSRDNRTDLSE